MTMKATRYRQRAGRSVPILALLVLVGMTGCGEGVERGSADAEPASFTAQRVDPADPAQYSVFEELPERGRITLHLLVAADAERESIRAAVLKEVEERKAADPSLSAIRIIGFKGEMLEQSQARLFPAVWAEWLPPSGWTGAADAPPTAVRRTYFYFDASPEW